MSYRLRNYDIDALKFILCYKSVSAFFTHCSDKFQKIVDPCQCFIKIYKMYDYNVIGELTMRFDVSKGIIE